MNVKCVRGHPKCNIDYTYESMSNHQRSCIDHFVVSDDLYDSINYCDGDNRSDHDAVSMELALNIKYDFIDAEFVRKPLWRKATQNHLSEYKRTLDLLLSNVSLPEHVIRCDDNFCCTHQNIIQEYHDNIIAASIQASACIPSTKQGNGQKIISGWNEFVREYKEKAIFWHKLWKDNCSPNSGILFDIRRKTRWEYHRILKAVKRNKETISAERMAKGLSGTGFWSEVKRTLGHSKSLPNTVDGMQGNEQIASLFKDKYDQLYNSVGYNAQQMAALQREIDANLSNSNARYDRFAEITVDDI